MATEFQYASGEFALIQAAPALVEIKIEPGLPFPSERAAATRLNPSVEEATDAHSFSGAAVCVHVIPESAEAWIWMPFAATSLVPSAEEATATHPQFIAVVWCQLKPESAER
jgi:hypothetical protein